LLFNLLKTCIASPLFLFSTNATYFIILSSCIQITHDS
jgi:hypothetical protein